MNRIEEYRFSILPQHIAFILDGNGRWAKAKGLIRTMGHEKGIKTLVNIVKEVRNLGIKFMSVFAFSTENWNRPSSEVNYLMTRALDEFKKYEAKLNEFVKNNELMEESTLYYLTKDDEDNDSEDNSDDNTNNDNTSDDEKRIENLNRKIEYSILQQLIYREKTKTYGNKKK